MNTNIGLSCDPDSVWIPSKGNFFSIFIFHFYLVTVSHYSCLLFWSLLNFIFKTFDLSEIIGMLTAYINMCGGFRYIVYRYYYGKSDRGVLPDIFEKYTYPSWPQTLSFECREVRKRKNEQCSPCPFCVRICFYREVGNYVIKNIICLTKAILLMNLLFLLMRRLSLILQMTRRSNLLLLGRWVVQV